MRSSASTDLPAAVAPGPAASAHARDGADRVTVPIGELREGDRRPRNAHRRGCDLPTQLDGAVERGLEVRYLDVERRAPGPSFPIPPPRPAEARPTIAAFPRADAGSATVRPNRSASERCRLLGSVPLISLGKRGWPTPVPPDRSPRAARARAAHPRGPGGRRRAPRAVPGSAKRRASAGPRRPASRHSAGTPSPRPRGIRRPSAPAPRELPERSGSTSADTVALAAHRIVGRQLRAADAPGPRSRRD